MKELMTCILETLDLEDLRGEIIRYALNSEVFYAFPLSYLISLLQKITLVGVSKGSQGDEMIDLLKTIQIAICLKRKEINYFTLRKIIMIHSSVPVYNARFL